MLRSKFLVCGLMVAVPFAANANLVLNGDFSAGNTGFTTSYSYFKGTGDALFGAPPGSNQSTPGTDMWDEGVYTITDSQPKGWHELWRNNLDLTNHGYFMLFNGSTNGGGSTAWSQTISLVNNQKYRLSFDLATVFGGDSNPANLNIKIGTQNVGSVVAPAGTDQWSNVFLEFTYSDAWGSAANILNIQTAASGNDFGIDNISVEAVPEPATLALGALGIGAFLRKRAKKK